MSKRTHVSRFWRHRRTLSRWRRSLGCGLVTVLVFTMPVWAFSAATRGPRFALAMLVGLVLVLTALAVLTRLVRAKRAP